LQMETNDLERYFIGQLLNPNANVEEMVAELDVDCFYDSDAMRFFKVIKEIVLSSEVVDFMTVTSKLLEQHGNSMVAEFMAMKDGVASIANWRFYADKIKENYSKHKIKEIGLQLVQAGESLSFDEALGVLQDSMDSLKLSDSSSMSMTDIIEKDADRPPPVAEVGITDFIDKYVCVCKQHLHVIAGRPSVGKTTMMTWLASKIKNKKTLIFTLEQPRHEIVDMITAASLGQPRQLVKEDRRHFWGKMNAMEHIIINERARTASAIEAQILAIRPDIVFIDNIQALIVPPAYRGKKTEYYEEFCIKLKSIAVSRSVCMFLLAQISRDIEKGAEREPNLSDLRDSGGIEQQADAIFGLYLRNGDDQNINFKLMKNREGAGQGSVFRLFFEKETGRFG
jgi:replicative DNA helicase